MSRFCEGAKDIFADYRQISTFKVPIEAEACVFSDQQGKNLPPGG